MKLRDLRYAAALSWPPTWRSWSGSGAVPDLADGTLASVRLRPTGDGLIVERLVRGHRQDGLLLWDGKPDPVALLERLTSAVGRPIAELGGSEV
jgi:hypothetical protein